MKRTNYFANAIFALGFDFKNARISSTHKFDIPLKFAILHWISSARIIRSMQFRIWFHCFKLHHILSTGQRLDTKWCAIWSHAARWQEDVVLHGNIGKMMKKNTFDFLYEFKTFYGQTRTTLINHCLNSIKLFKLSLISF